MEPYTESLIFTWPTMSTDLKNAVKAEGVVVGTAIGCVIVDYN